MRIVRAKSGRKIPGIFRYWRPRRLTLEANPPVYAWLWWNIALKEEK